MITCNIYSPKVGIQAHLCWCSIRKCTILQINHKIMFSVFIVKDNCYIFFSFIFSHRVDFFYLFPYPFTISVSLSVWAFTSNQHIFVLYWQLLSRFTNFPNIAWLSIPEKNNIRCPRSVVTEILCQARGSNQRPLNYKLYVLPTKLTGRTLQCNGMFSSHMCVLMTL